MRSTEAPGIHVYTSNGYSLYEIDGEKNKLYAQNLCLFAKLFLDTKSVFYDVTTFLYYLLVAHNPTPDIPNTQPAGGSAKVEEHLSQWGHVTARCCGLVIVMGACSCWGGR